MVSILMRSHLFLQCLCLLASLSLVFTSQAISIQEASITDLQLASKQNKLTSRQLTKFYLCKICRLNPVVRAIIEVNPDGLKCANRADQESKAKKHDLLSILRGIPILLKDNIGTKDKQNTMAGLFALLGSTVARDAGVVARLRRAGAVILGKANMNEWKSYVLSADPCSISSGSAISVVANMVAVSLGTETNGSILCPASLYSAVGIKPTLGLTSRAGVIPITPRQDTTGPICRTVSDAVYVLDAIVGYDHNDAEATREASKYIPRGGYKVSQSSWSLWQETGQAGAVLVDNLKIKNIDVILNFNLSGKGTAVLAEFKIAQDAYLEELVLRSFADIIAFNQKNSKLQIGQDMFLASEATNGIGDVEKSALFNMANQSRNGFEKLMMQNNLDAIVTPGFEAVLVLAIGKFPGISVPAGYDDKGVPFGICSGGLKGSEPKLIEIAHSFEQATKIRKPPSFKP
ncbi:hypothetical protein ACJRO7_027825 [Eucalyptus globulus]|uniref:Amidase domain-containing protein n=1 Tax=Eucalyptus globulus TaxID=34317 RepID=A0ABD3JUZ4_EUCGL